MSRQIPGYYYDEERKKYFKIEKNVLAPPDAPWSSGSVKRRQDEEAERMREMKKMREEDKARAGRVKRVGLLTGGMGGSETLGRETTGDGISGGRRCWPTLWAGGLVGKGSVNLANFWGQIRGSVLVAGGERGMVPNMWVGGDEEGESGMGVVWSGLRHTRGLLKSFIPRNHDDVIDFDSVPYGYTYHQMRVRHEYNHSMGQVSSVKYQEWSRRVFVTCEQATDNFSVYVTGPGPTESNASSHVASGWAPGDQSPVKRYRLAGHKRLSQQGFVYTCAPAPSGSSFTCAVGTSLGLLQLRPEDGLSWLTAAPPMAGEIQSSSGKAGQERRYDEIFAIDFLSSNPDVILYGGRDPRVRVLDPRTVGSSMRHGSSLYINHTSSTCHIKAVGEHRFLVAGPRSAMCVYDLRFLRDTDAESGRYRNIKNGTQPVVRFHDYKNEAYIDSGLDVLRGPEHGPGGGVVAAAHDDGKVALFSLRDGTRLKSPVVDQIDYQARRSDAGKRVVRSLAFSTLPGERLASLFVGGDSEVRKYSFQRGGQNGDDW